jgi:hypothetical protein
MLPDLSCGASFEKLIVVWLEYSQAFMEAESSLTVVIRVWHWLLFYTKVLLNDDDIFKILKCFLISVDATW